MKLAHKIDTHNTHSLTFPARYRYFYKTWGVVVIVWYFGLLVRSVSITTKVMSSNPVQGEVYSMQHYVIKFVSDLRHVDGFLRVIPFPPPIKLIAEILLKVALNTITLAQRSF